MTNILPSGIGDLFQLGGRVIHGLRRHGPWVLKNFITAEEMRGWLTTAQRTEAAFARARAARAVAEARCVEAEEKLTPWLAKARLVVMLALGSKWSQSWVAAGFVHRGTNVPKRLAARLELGRRLAEFFTAQRQFEVTFAGVTAAEVKALQRAILSAQKQRQAATILALEKKRDRDKAEKLLRWKMGAVRGALSLKFARDDPRWAAFGFNIPHPDAPAKQVFAPAPLERPMVAPSFAVVSLTQSAPAAA